MQGLLLLDVAPLSLGVAANITRDGIRKTDQMSVIIPRNSSIPIEKSHQYRTSKDYQSGFHERILQGEFPDADDNHQVADFRVGNIHRSPKG